MVSMETVLVILAIYGASAFLLGALARLFGAIVDLAAWLAAGMPRRTQAALASPSPAPRPARFPPIKLPKVGGY